MIPNIFNEEYAKRIEKDTLAYEEKRKKERFEQHSFEQDTDTPS